MSGFFLFIVIILIGIGYLVYVGYLGTNTFSGGYNKDYSSVGKWDGNPSGTYTCANTTNPGFCTFPALLAINAQHICTQDPNCIGVWVSSNKVSPVNSYNPTGTADTINTYFMRKPWKNR